MTQSQGPEALAVKTMFGTIAHGYDRANDVLSMGIHRAWRKKVLRLANLKAGDRVLDCATGTGDLAIAAALALGSGASVVGTDFCPEMLDRAPAKAKAAGVDVRFEVADVTNLPYESASFDLATISFGIRNVQDPLRGLSEMLRVLAPGGRLIVLEFGQSTIPGFRQIYELYANVVLPSLGGWITGRPEAYQYLQTSSSKFPCREEFLNMIRAAGDVSDLDYQSLTGGIAYIYRAIKK